MSTEGTMLTQEEVDGWRARAQELREGADPKWPDEASPEEYERVADFVEEAGAVEQGEVES